MAHDAPRKALNPAPARRRGRPLGSAPYRQRDEALLARFADELIGKPDLRLAPFVQAAGLSESAIRRVQLRWRSNKERFLNEARIRFEGRPPQSLAEIVMHLWAGLSRTTRVFSKNVLDPLRASMRRAERRWEAQEALGKPARLPLDPSHPTKLKPALNRFESAMPTPGSDEIDDLLGDKTFEELPFSMQLYLIAVLTHEVSLEQRRNETKASRMATRNPKGERR